MGIDLRLQMLQLSLLRMDFLLVNLLDEPVEIADHFIEFFIKIFKIILVAVGKLYLHIAAVHSVKSPRQPGQRPVDDPVGEYGKRLR